MTSLKAATAIAILSAAIATPALAQDARPTPQARAIHHHHHQDSFRRAYNQSSGLYDPEVRRNREALGVAGHDHCSWADCVPPWELSGNGG
jgi:hypothetical protein